MIAVSRKRQSVVDENVKLALTLTRQADEGSFRSSRRLTSCVHRLPRPPRPRSDEREPPADPIRARRVPPLRAAFSEHDRSRLAYSAARAGDDDYLVFDSLQALLSSLSELIAKRPVCRNRRCKRKHQKSAPNNRRVRRRPECC